MTEVYNPGESPYLLIMILAIQVRNGVKNRKEYGMHQLDPLMQNALVHFNTILRVAGFPVEN